MEKVINVVQNFSATDNEAAVIVDGLTELALAYSSDHYVSKGLCDESFKMDKKEYSHKNKNVKDALLGYCASKSGLEHLSLNTKEGVARAFSNPTFGALYNSIVVEAISGVVANSNPTALLNLCNIETVGLGDSYTAEIETKGLPVAQRSSYMTNVTRLNGVTKQSITITPKEYALGVQMDYIRIVDRTFDFGKEVAKVAMALLYAQYQLVAGLIFDTNKLNGTPFYSATYASDKVVKMISDLQAVNGGAEVKAYGTLTAFNKAGTIATTNFGFESQDQMIRDGFLGRAFGVDNIVIPQATDLSQPFTGEAPTILLPVDVIVLLSSVGDKPVTLVRENYAYAKETDATRGSLHKVSYSYHMQFDAAIVTQAHYGLIKVAQ